MPLFDRLYITEVHPTVEDAQTFFPYLDHTQWKMNWHEDHPADEKHQYAFTFQHWDRVAE